MAQQHYQKHLLDEQVVLKKYFYVLRPVLACRWIKEHHAAPAVDFMELATETLPESLWPIVNDLLETKRFSPEVKKIAPIPELNRFLTEQITIYQEYTAALSNNIGPDWQLANRLFLQIIEDNFPADPEHPKGIYARSFQPA